MERISGNGKQHCPCQCHWDLSWLRFGDSRIAVTDVDGLFAVERRGRFLFIETKRYDEPLTQGQEILLRELSQKPGFTVIVLYGDDSEPEVIRRMEQGALTEVEPTSRADIQRRIDNWYARANARRIRFEVPA